MSEKVLRSIYLDIEQVERLKKLSAQTKVPQAVYVREALDLVLNKYKKQLIGRSQKRERPSQVGKLKGLNKETLERLYVKEGKSIYTIAKMFGCTSMTVWTRCKKYGIKTRTRGKRIIKIKKPVLQKLYVREGKSIEEIARMFSLHPYTVRMKCEQYSIEIKDHRIVEGLTESLLQKWYVKEGKSTREIAKIIGCSREPVRLKLKQFGIPLRPPGIKRVDIDDPTLRRLYVKEGKSASEVAKIFDCSVSVISQRFKQFGLKKRT